MASTSKKRKVEPESTKLYVEGSILRIKVENFVTYDSVEFRPGPHLNVIIGPNGTGKSTIVCAICLGLAGKPSLLGRASQPTEFVKHGQQKATIEIELMNKSGENYVIRREITKKNNTSTWTVNGRHSSLKAVEETVARLNIQVSNLCQFLPQDKVADFAKMSQVELLESTEKAVGALEMFDNHQKLKSAQKTARDLDLAAANTKETLEREKQKNSRLEQDVKDFQVRQRHIEKIKILKMKKPWVEYEDHRQLYNAEREKKDCMSQEVSELKKKNAPLVSKVNKAKEKVKELDIKLKQKNDAIKEHARKAAAKSKEIEDLNDNVEEIQSELKEEKAEDAKRKRKIQEMKIQVDSLQNDVANLDESEDVQPKLQDSQREMKRVSTEMNNVTQQGNNVKYERQQTEIQIRNLQGELQRLQDVSNRRMEMLRHKHIDTYNAVMWLRSNRHRFKATIYNPIMLLVNVTDMSHAKFIEEHIAYRDMRAFVCQDKDDVELFLGIMRDEQKLRVNAVRVPDEPLTAFQPRHPLNKYTQFGFFSYLKDMFECPDDVMRYLCLMYRVHNIPVGTKKTRDNLEKVMEQAPELNTFYTDNHQFNIKRSKYTGLSSSRSVEIKKPHLLTVTMDLNRERELLNQVQEKQDQLTNLTSTYQGFQRRSKDLEAEMNKLRNERKALMEKRDMKKGLEQKIRLKQANIERLESEATDIAAEEARVAQTIRGICNKKMSMLEALQKETQQCTALTLEKVRLSLQHATAHSQVLRLEAHFRDSTSELQKKEREFEFLKENLKRIKDRARNLLEAAKKATNTASNEELSPEMKNAFSMCPDNVDEIDAAIHDEQARADLTFQTNESVVEEYNRRKKHIQKLEEESRKRDRAVITHQEEIDQVKAQWLEPLKDLISRINTNFSYFFSAMKCAGEVDLNVPDNPEDYDKYGVCIKVKFRDTEQLRELTPTHQSGGERSVSTVLYMMALQELTKCPFRCVDEINQGMDPHNERRVFELVVQTVCQRNTSQYFLLTPKLLPNLDYADDMSVLCVYNGPQMVNHTEWSLSKFLRRRSRLD